MNAVGMIELRSIARGVEVADTMMKTAQVKLVMSQTVCPGKYMILVTGDTSAVKSAIDNGIAKGSPYVVSHLNIPNIEGEVINAIEGVVDAPKQNTVGILEYYSIADVIIAADTALKSSQVHIIEIRLGYAIGGKAFVTISGELSNVRSAIDAAKNLSLENGMLMECSIISSIDSDVYSKLL